MIATVHKAHFHRLKRTGIEGVCAHISSWAFERKVGPVPPVSVCVLQGQFTAIVKAARAVVAVCNRRIIACIWVCAADIVPPFSHGEPHLIGRRTAQVTFVDSSERPTDFIRVLPGGNIDVEMLSKGIYMAMTTTVAGLVVGIIAYISYNLLVSKVEKVVFMLEATTTEFMDLLHHNK